MSATTACTNDPASALCFVEQTQMDGRLLLRFVTRRDDRTLFETTALNLAAGAPAGQAVPAQPVKGQEEVRAEALALLFEDSASVAQSPEKVARLVACVDHLSQRAKPANVRSIRLTYSYLNIAMEGGEPPAGIRSEARRTKLFMGLVTTLGLLLLLMALILLAFMDSGRRHLTQLRDLRVLEADIRKDIATLSLEESSAVGILTRHTAGQPEVVTVVPMNAALEKRVAALWGLSDKAVQEWPKAAPLCERPDFLQPSQAGTRKNVVVRYDTSLQQMATDDEISAMALTWWREPITPKAAAICRRHDDLRVRLAMVYVSMADWNCRSDGLWRRVWGLVNDPFPAAVRQWLAGYGILAAREAPPPQACGGGGRALPPEISQQTWQSHESRVIVTSSVVSGFLLPLFLGSLGGCAYAMRRIDQKLSQWTLEPQDGRHAIVRVALAAVLGGLLGVVVTSGEAVTLGGFSLSLAALAFFVGFSVEPVFRAIERLVIDTILSAVGDKGRKPPAAG